MRYSEFKALNEAGILSNLGSKVAQGAKTFASKLGVPTAGSRAALSTKFFVKSFLGTLDATQKRQQQMGQPFDLNTFANAYMKKYNWQPGSHKPELDAAIRANNSNQLALVMDKIGSENSVDPDAQGPEIDMTNRTEPTMGGVAQDQVTTQQAQQSKLGVKQINAIVPKLRTRDLTSVKNNIDKTLATRKGSSSITKPTTSAMGSMAGQLSGKNPIGKSKKSSTGGRTMTTPTGKIHTAGSSNPNITRPYQG